MAFTSMDEKCSRYRGMVYKKWKGFVRKLFYQKERDYDQDGKERTKKVLKEKKIFSIMLSPSEA